MKNPGLVISWQGRKVALGLLELPAGDAEIRRLHLPDGIYQDQGGHAFAGFHDWIHEGGEEGESARLLGVEVFPLDEDVEARLRAKWGEGRYGAGPGYRVDFHEQTAEGRSGGEQAFMHHQYFLSDAGEVAMVVDLGGVNEMELQDLLRRGGPVAWT